MTVSAEMIKCLRDKSGAGVMECRNALVKFSGDLDKATEFLRQKGKEIAEKKKDRATSEGKIESYIHTGGKVGALLEVNCETDFCAKSEDFCFLVKELALQIAALSPKYVSIETVPQEAKKQQEESYHKLALEEKKTPEVTQKIVEGRMKKFYQENCLLSQPYIRDDAKTVEDLVNEIIGKVKENIVIRRFVRFCLQD